MSDDLVAQLDALGEDDFYYSPATTKAKINEAKAALESQAARIAQLEATLRELFDAEMDAIVQRILGAKPKGGKDE